MMQKIMVIFSILMLFSLFSNNANAQKWPNWFSQVEKCVTENLISHEEFSQAREYLYDNEIFVYEKSQQLDSQRCEEIDASQVTGFTDNSVMYDR